MKQEPQILTTALDSSQLQSFDLQTGSYGLGGYIHEHPQTQPSGLGCYPCICIRSQKKKIPEET